MTDANRAVLVVTGPTASGKTDLAVTLAERLGGELIGADSVQVYRGFDIGSAKPRAKDLRGVPHHLLDVADADAPMDAAQFARLADDAIDAVARRGRVPIVVGGSGLWLRALLRGLVALPAVDPALREALSREADARGSASLHEALRRVDPRAAGAIHPHDRVRILRALEVFRQTGEALGELRARHALGTPRYRALRIVLDPGPERLRPRIERRVDSMLQAGWADEVRALVARYGREARPLRSVGYAQMLEHVEGDLPLTETRRRIVKATWVYTRRQRTWLRREPGALWVVTSPDEVLCPHGMEHLRQVLEPTKEASA